MRKALFLITLAFIYCQITGQKGYEIVDIRKYSEDDIKKLCWHTLDSVYSTDTIPVEFENESAVFIYQINSMECLHVGDYHNVSNLKVNKIKIIDKSALDDFSELYFPNYKYGEYINFYRSKDYIGVRIIKSDNQIIEIDTSSFISEGSGKKVAIKNLEIGDILQYYSFDMDNILSNNPYCFFGNLSSTIVLNSTYPILKYEYAFYTNGYYSLCYSSNKTDIEFEEKELFPDSLSHKKYYVTCENLKGVENVPFQYTMHTLPVLRTSCKVNSNPVKQDKLKDSNGIERSITSSDILNSDYPLGIVSIRKRLFSKFLETKGNSYSCKNDSILEHMFYLKHHIVADMVISKEYFDEEQIERRFTKGFFKRLSEYYSVDFDRIVALDRSQGSIYDALGFNYTVVTRINTNDSIWIAVNNQYSRFNQLPYQVEGTNAFRIIYTDSASELEPIVLPVSSLTENRYEYRANITLGEEDANIKLNFSCSGHFIDKYGDGLIDWVATIKKQHEYYNTEDWINPESISKRLDKQYDEFINNNNKTLEESYTKFLESMHEDSKATLDSYKPLTSGCFLNDTILSAEIEYTLGEAVKKVGPNYMLSIGKLVGGQITLDEDDMQRDVDIYIDYPKTYSYAVNIAVPEGYEPVGLENLTNSINNEAGSLYSEASFANGTITMTFIKIYKKNYLPASDWDKMKEFLIPAADFTEKEVLLKKL